MPYYTYRPLLPAKNSIRLIQILPGLPGSDIHCHIIDYAIRDDQVSGLFEALSYVWGEPTEKCRIHVSDAVRRGNGVETAPYLDITVNLHAALQQLRDTVLPRLMWIDALCIKQDDLAERAHQVQFMAKLYSHASRVIVWLGAEGNGSAELSGTIKDVTDTISRLPSTSRRESSELISPYKNKQNVLQPQLVALFNRPWFRRVWVLQEVAAARHIVVKCGLAELLGSVFTTGMRYLNTHALKVPTDIHNLCISVLEVMEWNISSSHRQRTNLVPRILGNPTSFWGPSLGELLDKFHSREASDERDKIFALLGMCSTESSGLIVPDYTERWGNVWKRTIKQILGARVIVTTWDDRQQACITAPGTVLGVFDPRNPKQHHCFQIHAFEPDHGKLMFGSVHWRASCHKDSWCKAVQAGDIVFHIAGAEQPSVIRACGDHFDIVVIALPRPSDTTVWPLAKNEARIEWEHLLAGGIYGRQDVTLVWDWKSESPIDHQFQLHHTLLESRQSNTVAHPTRPTRIRNSARILADTPENPFSHSMLNDLFKVCPGYDVPTSVLKAMQVLHLMHLCPITWMWLVQTLEEYKWILWILQREAIITFPASLFIEYRKSDIYLGYNLYDLVISLGLSLRLPGTRYESVKLICTSLAEAEGVCHLSGIFDDELRQDRQTYIPSRLFGTVISRRHVAGLIIRSMTSTLNTKPPDLRMTPLSIIAQPSIFRRFRSIICMGHRPSMNNRAMDLLFEILGDSPDTRLSILISVIAYPVAMEPFCVLFSKSFSDIAMAYKVLNSILGICLDVWQSEHPFSLVQIRKQKQPSEFMWNRATPRRILRLFLACSLHLLLRYIRDTNLLETAALSMNDYVLPFFCNICQSRSFTRIGMASFKENVVRELDLYRPYFKEDDFLRLSNIYS